MVFHIGTELLDEGDIFDELMAEVAMLALLGVRPVLLVGTRQQVDRKLQERGHPLLYTQGHRITDEETLDTVREVSGYARSRVEGALARVRAKVGPTSGVGVDVVGGNFFFTAQARTRAPPHARARTPHARTHAHAAARTHAHAAA